MTRKRASRRRASPPLTHILFFATTASAVSLANFQIITDPRVPLNCIAVYNQQFFGCAVSDFQGRGCTSECREGVASTQASLQRTCGFIEQPANSFLGTALRGGLVPRLCGNVVAPSTAQRQTTITVGRGTPAPSTTARGQLPSTTIGGNRPTTSAQRGITQTIGELPSSTVVEQPIPQPTQQQPDQQPTPAIGDLNQSTTSEQPAAETPSQQQGQGAGSPFDNPIRDAAERGVRWSQGAILGTVVGYLLVW